MTSRLSELEHRTHIIHKEHDEKHVLLYEDHRTLAFVLWVARHELGLLKGPVTLVMFDYHDDARTPVSAMAQIKKFRANPPTEREFHSFVEWDLGPIDDDWLLASMELDLVGDVLLFGAQKTSNLDQTSNETIHKDHTGQEHRIWECGHLWGALSRNGCLVEPDVSAAAPFQDLRRAIGWDARSGFVGEVDEAPEVVLDFDLDCFTGPLGGRTYAWPHLLEEFRTVHVSHGRAHSAERFLRSLAERVSFTTIARESPYCGGTSESQAILATVCEVLWGEPELF